MSKIYLHRFRDTLFVSSTLLVINLNLFVLCKINSLMTAADTTTDNPIISARLETGTLQKTVTFMFAISEAYRNKNCILFNS